MKEEGESVGVSETPHAGHNTQDVEVLGEHEEVGQVAGHVGEGGVLVGHVGDDVGGGGAGLGGDDQSGVVNAREIASAWIITRKIRVSREIRNS